MIKKFNEMSKPSSKQCVWTLHPGIIMDKFEEILRDDCSIKIDIRGNNNYQVDIKQNVGGLHKFDIIGVGQSLETAIEDAINVFYNRDDLRYSGTHGKDKWKYKKIDARDQ